jgi:uncharacterized protein (DUF2267 family)
MDELIKQVAAKAGISEEQARSAVTTVIGFLKDKLPAPIAAQIDNTVSGEGGTVGDLASKVGGFFSK